MSLRCTSSTRFSSEVDCHVKSMQSVTHPVEDLCASNPHGLFSWQTNRRPNSKILKGRLDSTRGICLSGYACLAEAAHGTSKIHLV